MEKTKKKKNTQKKISTQQKRVTEGSQQKSDSISPLFPGLSGETERLLKAFQTNLLSLISHELRTPLTGIINSLTLLQEDVEALPKEELISMATRNANRLQETLAALLDLASMETGSYYAKLREIDLRRIFVRAQSTHLDLLAKKGLKLKLNQASQATHSLGLAPVLADPQKLSRAIELSFHLMNEFADHGSTVSVDVSEWKIQIEFFIEEASIEDWIASSESSKKLPKKGLSLSIFRGIVNSESEFLTRHREGLGSEFVLIQEMLRVQGGDFSEKLEDGKVTLKFQLPVRTTEEGLKAVVLSRVYETSTGLNSVALASIAVPADTDLEDFQKELQDCLFRSSDAAYGLKSSNQVMLVLNDCKQADAPGLLQRIEKSLNRTLYYGVVVCPEEGTDPVFLIELAQKRLKHQLQKVSKPS